MTKKQRSKRIAELKREQNIKNKQLEKRVTENEEWQKVVDNGFRVEEQIVDNEKVKKHIKISPTEKKDYESKIAKNDIKIFELEKSLDAINYELEFLLTEDKNESKAELKSLVREGMEYDDNSKLKIIEMAYEKGKDEDIEEIMTIGEELTKEEYPYTKFKKAVIPILNKYRNTKKQRPITNLRRHTAEKLMNKIENLVA